MEKLSNRPAGGREGDFDELSDWTITDIATSQKSSPEDRQNAEAEIARREEAGTYNPDEASREVREDLLSHGYGAVNGKVLYPKPEYKAWLESDRSTPIPSGVVRESIEDRLELEKQEASKTREAIDADSRRASNRATGEAAVEAFVNAPIMEKIYHPSQKSAKKDETSRERKAKKKAADVEIASRRKMKEFKKYDNSFLDSKKIAVSEARANLPLVEVVEQSNKRIRDPQASANRLYNYYENDFSKKAPRWISSGIVSKLEKGEVNPSTAQLVLSGFWAREGEKIHERINPDDVFSTEAIDAESHLKIRVAKDLIAERIREINDDEIRDAKRDGLLHAIESGARIDSRSGKPVYSIPFEQGNEVIGLMKEVGINPDANEEDKKLLMASYQGFANIIEAIKTNDKETEKGFKTLDWYFDTFNYKEKIGDFLDVMDAFQENADDNWTAKLEDYLDTRDEIKKYLKQLEQKPIPQLTQVEEISQEELTKIYENLVKSIAGQPATLQLFPDIERYPVYNHTGAVLPVNLPPTSVQKLGKIVTEFASIKAFDPNANIYKGVFVDSNNKSKQYMIIRYGMRNSNIAIAAPIENLSNDASYVWIGQTGENRDGWMEAFVQNPDPNTPTSKYQAHHRDDVRAHNHIAAMKTRGLRATDNMWFNIYADINKRAI